MNQTRDPGPEISTALLRFVEEDLLADGTTVDIGQNLLGDGVVDSLGMLRVVGFIEANYPVKIPPAQFTIENFRSIDVITQFVCGLLGDGT
jgi:acyl carrier protein